MKHEGRSALVTGGAGGIGLAIARALVAEGADVTIADRDESAAVIAATELQCQFWVADLSDPKALDHLDLDFDILVNNAGIQHVQSIIEFDIEVFRRMNRLMVEAPFRLIQAALPSMYENGWGRIINVSSVHGLRASPYKSAYVMAKHGLEGLSKVVALEAGSRGVTSNCVNPGYVRTPLVEAQISAQASAHDLPADRVLEDVMLTNSAIKRLVEPAEVADLVSWLASDQARMITGSSYTIDGGWTAR